MSRATPRFRRNSPPLPAAFPNIIRITCVGDVENQVTINTFYYSDGGGALDVDRLGRAANAWRTTFGDDYRACMSSDWTWRFVKAESLSNFALVPAIRPTGDLAGTGAAGHEPTTVAVCITRISSVRGQCGRGRVYLPAVPTTSVFQSQIAILARAAYTQFALDMRTGFVEGGFTYVPQVVSHGPRLAPGHLGASAVLETRLNITMATIRRRSLGRGV